MRCHYCDEEAAVTAETGGVKVGLCEQHFRDRLQELSESEEFADLEEKIDVESME